jgi:signal peptidase I
MGFDRVSMAVPVMEPEIIQGEQLLIDTWAYNSEKPKRGDIVIHSFDGQAGVYLNRITALGGETIEIKEGKVFINGVLTKENYVRSENARKMESMNMPLTVVPPNCYFVMGDNRDRSLGDSRFNGPIHLRSIKGKATYVLYSSTLTRIGEKLK